MGCIVDCSGKPGGQDTVGRLRATRIFPGKGVRVVFQIIKPKMAPYAGMQIVETATRDGATESVLHLHPVPLENGPDYPL